MSVHEIIAELPKLSQPELERVDQRLHELLGKAPAPPTSRPWGEALLELAGSATGLPADLAQNHDHYLHGAPRR